MLRLGNCSHGPSLQAKTLNAGLPRSFRWPPGTPSSAAAAATEQQQPAAAAAAAAGWLPSRHPTRSRSFVPPVLDPEDDDVQASHTAGCEELLLLPSSPRTSAAQGASLPSTGLVPDWHACTAASQRGGLLHHPAYTAICSGRGDEAGFGWQQQQQQDTADEDEGGAGDRVGVDEEVRVKQQGGFLANPALMLQRTRECRPSGIKVKYRLSNEYVESNTKVGNN